jgi:predicted ATPase
LGQPLVFDDLQWCDAATLEVFVFLASQGRTRLYATCRKSEVNTTLQAVLGTLRRQASLTTIELEPFKQQDIKRLLADLIGIPKGPQKFSGWLFARSSGNVLFALETLKNLFEGGILQERDGNWHSDLDGITQDYAELSVPPKVAELIERRLELLPPEAQRVVQASIVMQEGFTPSVLAQLVGLSELATLEALEQAESSGLTKGEAFSHDLFRQSIYETLTHSRRKLQHRMLAELLQTQPLVGARHWRQAGELERAWELELEVAKTQLERGLLNNGLTMLEKIIQEAPKGHSLHLETLVVAGTYLYLQDTGRTGLYLNEVLSTPKLEPTLKFRALLAG